MTAQNEHKQTLGYVALEEHSSFPGMMEMCSLVVKPYARGRKIAQKLHTSIIQEAHKININGLLCEPVTYHNATQKLCNENNFTPCGIYFNYYAPEVVGPYAESDRRIDGSTCIKIFNHEAVHELYLPDECSQFVCNIFDSEQLKYTLNANHNHNKNCPEQSLINYSVDSYNKSFTLTVDRIGSDFSSQSDSLREQYENKSVELVILYLSMNDSSCPECYKNFRDEGFIFSGCLPGSSSGDYIILQHLKGRPVVKGKDTLEANYLAMTESLYAMNGI